MQRETASVVQRKKEARAKIILGGLVYKAGLQNVNRAFLMGGLLMLAKMAPGSDQFEALRRLGQEALSGEETELPSPSKDPVNDEALA
ncbi:conjugal transfer protein TraD [Microvirga puerhi]|uniref:Conjugal transfer protein TraD n=1 Tax=Microvirga puerhi TaxID=2876078 RepID=A0ABS7VUJ8_9HYPH|nr:conjugal transfer protein TraD [Microvirga puerhi]MBZ6078849.1 conjugal transfer protein TraD [Microvirga puerhi]